MHQVEPVSMNLRIRRVGALCGLLAALAGCQVRAGDVPPLPAGPPPRSLPDAPIPKTFDEAILTLRQRMPAEVVMAFRRAPDAGIASDYHESLGRWLRNYWGLWAHGPLYQDIQRHGVDEPEEMSELLLSSVWRQLHEEAMTVDEHVAAHRRYWREHTPPPPPPLPRTGRR